MRTLSSGVGYAIEINFVTIEGVVDPATRPLGPRGRTIPPVAAAGDMRVSA